MRFLSICTTLLAGMTALVAAQAANPITFPVNGEAIKAGSTVNIKWTPTTQGSITLTLRYGASTNLQTSNVIAPSVPNSGSFSWSVPTNIGNGQWALEISDSTGVPSNYSPFFTVSGGTGTQGSASTTPASDAAKATSAVSSKTSEASASASSKASSISSALSSASSSVSSRLSSASSAAASATSAPTSGAAVKQGAGSFAAALGFGALVVLA